MKTLDPRKASVALAWLLAAVLPSWAQSPAASGVGAGKVVRAVLLPHETNPDTWPQPDYFDEVLRQTRLKPGAHAAEVNLQAAPAGAPPRRYLVLPVQTQAFGYAPGFRAIAGALLDHELAVRGLDANWQTEVMDGHGPLVRRLGDGAFDALIQQHRPAGGALALYLGHDGADTTFVTLLLKDGTGTTARRAHRSLALSTDPRQAVRSLAAVLPALLKELGLAGGPVPAARARASACGTQTWNLAARRPVAGTTETACQALVVGTLMPRLGPTSSNVIPPDLPGRMAWLAMAFVEAGPGAQSSRTHAAIQALAWAQLMDNGSLRQPSPYADMADPVIRPLVDLLSMRALTRNQPVRSAREEIARQLERASAGLPGFTRVAFVESGLLGDEMHQVDACAFERAFPGAMVTARCRVGAGPSATPGQASPAQAALQEQWRLAAFHKDIVYFGSTIGDRPQAARLLASLPDDVARHPFIQQERFTVDGPGAVTAGTFEAQLSRTREAVKAFVQSTVDSQRYSVALMQHSLSWHPWTTNRNIAYDREIAPLQEAERRLLAVLDFDRFATSTVASNPLRRAAGGPVDFLPPAQAAPSAAMRPPAMSASGPPRVPPLFPLSGHAPPDAASLRARLAAEPSDMDTRVALAMLALKEGAPAAQARALIDGQAANRRSDERIGESHVWATPAHAYFFAGDLESAGTYYQRVRQIGTYSESDLHARVRVRMIDGDVRGALAATQERLQRYESDYARRDMAAFLFMTSRPAEAWDLVLPGLASTTSSAPWMAVLTGHRLEGKDFDAVSDWITKRGLKGSQIASRDAGPSYLHLHAVMDRLPGDKEIQALGPGSAWSDSALLVQMALSGSVPKDRFDRLRKGMEWHQGQNGFMQPLFSWVAWHATANQDPELEKVRKATLQSVDFDTLLSKSMLLALDGQASASLDFLRAARFQMSEIGLGSPIVDRAVPAPYQYALAGYLMFRKTGHDAYRVETLRIAKAYQRAVPFWGWPYAMEALLERNPQARGTALCRAMHLDRNSYFLGLARAGSSPVPPDCRKSLW